MTNTSANFYEKIANMNDNNKKIDDTVFYLDHPSDDNEGHPCMTKFGSFDAGKPCIFPFK